MIRPARRDDSSQDKSPSNGLDGGPDSLRLLQVVGKSRSSGVSDSRKLLVRWGRGSFGLIILGAKLELSTSEPRSLQGRRVGSDVRGGGFCTWRSELVKMHEACRCRLRGGGQK
jgi:hypothetical protein